MTRLAAALLFCAALAVGPATVVGTVWWLDDQGLPWAASAFGGLALAGIPLVGQAVAAAGLSETLRQPYWLILALLLAPLLATAVLTLATRLFFRR